VRLVRTGNHFESFRSTDGQTWTSNGTADIAMASTVYVGLAVTSHDASKTVSATLDQLAVTAPTPAVNQPPTVSLTSPANNATFTAPATIALAATASDPENRMARVEFYSGTTLLGTATGSPYAFSWTSVPAGSYSLTAVAYDADGARTTSAAVSVTVTTGTTSSWTVQFNASADHDTNVSSYRLDVFASGADPATASPLATISLGKPTPDASRLISVSEAPFFTALAAGNYVATVSAIGPGGESRSAPYAFTR